MRRDIDEALQDWPYDPEAGECVAREVRTRDGRTVVQIRVERPPSRWARVEVQQYPRAVLDALCQVER